jgi:dienelactone hydrolase
MLPLTIMGGIFMKKIISELLMFCMLFCFTAGFAAIGTKENQKNLDEKRYLEMSSEELKEKFNEEMHLARYIVNRGKAYEYDTFMKYLSFWFQKAWSVTDHIGVTIDKVENGREIVNTLTNLRKNLVQVVDDPEKVCWYIWGDNMAQANDAANYDYTRAFDEAGFKPFLVPYLYGDQDKVKGNVIIVAGGGFNQRCNDGEGDPVATFFNGIGYNAYVLQRRVAPSANIDSSLDLQRAIRYIRHNAKTLGIAKTNTIITMGFSGGGSTIMNQLNTCYGSIKPNAVYPDYKCDEIDSLNSDYAVAVIMYGAPRSGYTTKNQSMPSFFIAAGELDSAAMTGSLSLYSTAVANGWPAELYIAGGAEHGFGISGIRAATEVGFTNATMYPALLKTYLDVQLGYTPAKFR